jgi:transposase
MVTDQQVRKLTKNYQKSGCNLSVAAAKAGMDRKTARKWLDSGELPSQLDNARLGKSREDIFEPVFPEVADLLENNPGLEARTIFVHLQNKYPGKFQDGQLRTFQRRVKVWRATQGPPREVFFPQQHKPGVLSECDFTHMSKLGVTINRVPFNHLIFHFVLTYSNWETGTVCFSESFESLAEGLQNALWELGGTPEKNRIDRMSTAVNKVENPEEFTRRYRALLGHYSIKPQAINPASPNENGDVESLHRNFKRALDQALMMRDSRDFASRADYEAFLKAAFAQLNAGRRSRFDEELKVLGRLPLRRLESFTRETVKVGSGSTVRVKHNTYSVGSRLIGETVEARVYIDYIDIWYAQRRVERLPRLRGSGKHHVNYRHIIDWLVRKPGAFADYRYREDLFPSSTFRIAYDVLEKRSEARADREYLKILYLAARESESGVESVLAALVDEGAAISAEAVEDMLDNSKELECPREITVDAVDLATYDALLEGVAL